MSDEVRREVEIIQSGDGMSKANRKARTTKTCDECGRTIEPNEPRYETSNGVLCRSCAEKEHDEREEGDLAAERDERKVERSCGR